MDGKMEVSFDSARYQPVDVSSTPWDNTDPQVKYIIPRVVGHSFSRNLQSSVYGPGWPSLAPSHHTLATTTALGLAAFSQTTSFTTISAIHSINGQRIIDELRELSRLTELLGNVILECCVLETHLRAQQLQLEWLQTHQAKNANVIQAMYLNEIEAAEKLLRSKREMKLELESKINETQKTLTGNEEEYRQILHERTDFDQEIFTLERQIAQNNAEIQFLRRRVHYFDEQSKFYILRNESLEARKARLRYDLDEDTFGLQALKSEMELLEAEKITREDVHASALDGAQNAADISQLSVMLPSKAYRELLAEEVDRIQKEFTAKVDVYREALHRRFELDLHRYQIQKTFSSSSVTREHELQLETYIKEKQDVMQQIASVQSKIDETSHQIQTLEKQIVEERNDQDSLSNRKKKLAVMNEMIRNKEEQLREILRNRALLKKDIDYYKERLNRHPKQFSQNYYLKRVSYADFNDNTLPIEKMRDEGKQRRSMQELDVYTRREDSSTKSNASKVEIYHQPVISQVQQSVPQEEPLRTSFIQVKEFWSAQEEGTLKEISDFNINQDCEELHRLVINANTDETAIIRILCNRTATQRIMIRDRYRAWFNENLGDRLAMISNPSLNKLLRILLLSPVEYDCFELRRVLRESRIDETLLVEIIYARPNRHIRSIRETYAQLFQVNLEDDLSKDRDEESKQVLLTLYRASRPEENDVNDNAAYIDARSLYEAGSQWRGRDSTLLRLLCYRSNAQLKQIFSFYHQFSNIDIEEAIKVHFDGSLYFIYMAIVRIVRNRARFFAYELKKSIKGTATNEDTLNRIIVSRSEIDMVQIKSEYEKITKRTLFTHIQTDVEGSYKKALLELLRQRIESTRRDFSGSQNVQWRNPGNRSLLATTPAKPLTRSNSDRTTDRRVRASNTNGQQWNQNNAYANQESQVRTSTTMSIRARIAKSNVVERRSFAPLPSVEEQVSVSNHFEE